jgi:hypothetical protein
MLPVAYKTDLQEISIEGIDLTVLAQLAAHYSCAPMTQTKNRRYGLQDRFRPAQSGDDQYTAYIETRDKIIGVTLMKHHDNYSGGTRKDYWWFPLESLNNCKFVALGVQLESTGV